MNRYLTPLPAFTGALHQQPGSELTRSGWSLDQDYNYARHEFLDAPDIVPAGSVRALDSGSLTIGVGHTWRDVS